MKPFTVILHNGQLTRLVPVQAISRAHALALACQQYPKADQVRVARSVKIKIK